MPSLEPGQHIGIFGVTGTGKTEFLKRLLEQLRAQGRRIVALDCKNELSVLGRPRSHTQVGPLRFRWLTAQVAQQPAVLLNVQLELAVVPDEFTTRKCARTFQLLASLLKAIGEEGRDLKTVLVLEEVQLWADDVKKLLEEVATVWRDFGVTLILVSQRPAGIPIDARAQLQEIYSFAQSEPADIEALRLRCALTDPTYHERVARLTPESHRHEVWRAGQQKQLTQPKELDHGEEQRRRHQADVHHDERADAGGRDRRSDDLHVHVPEQADRHDGHRVQDRPVSRGEAQDVTAAPKAPVAKAVSPLPPPLKPKPKKRGGARRRVA